LTSLTSNTSVLELWSFRAFELWTKSYRKIIFNQRSIKTQPTMSILNSSNHNQPALSYLIIKISVLCVLLKHNLQWASITPQIIHNT